ncbi:ABC transporter ATP-binding protein [Saccharibacillus sp. CPCC 101409]|uniref:ATP-binding cassette domain-containing protein n=1 Tax=Saccharibacillus sp. CPCC 101409 TaxID=3058041 RepID=UPI0026738C1A|nr:ABC transporter ATP-binding protein [Saccharibacillus sp. CPCC 101409]MDO3412619.1 ABC transporter ATP-binding protein [Saccharibacillus sp. CPCC 101409]
MENTVVEWRGVVKRRERMTLGPVDIELRENHVTALIGRNGSGKSTLMKLAAGLIYPDAGEISWFGSAYPDGIPAEVRTRMSYVPENFATEEDGIKMDAAAEFRSFWYPSWDWQRYEELLRKFEVPGGKRLDKLSKGQRRKFEIAAALAVRPKLLLLDEPSSGLDPFAWKTMLEEIRRCVEEDRATVLLSTHIVEEVRRMADYLLLLDGGRSLGIREKDALLDAGREVWIEDDEELVRELPGVTEWARESEGMIRFVTTDYAGAAALLGEAGVRPIRARALELDEMMEHWMEGRLSS